MSEETRKIIDSWWAKHPNVVISHNQIEEIVGLVLASRTPSLLEEEKTLTLTDLSIAVREHTQKNCYPPKTILITLPQLHNLLLSGKELFRFFDAETLTRFEGIPVCVENDMHTLDMRISFNHCYAKES
jgi:hypothetical protein